MSMNTAKNALDEATQKRQEALELLHKTLDEYLSVVALNECHNGGRLRRAMKLQNFADAVIMLGSYMGEERLAIRQLLDIAFTQHVPGQGDGEEGQPER